MNTPKYKLSAATPGITLDTINIQKKKQSSRKQTGSLFMFYRILQIKTDENDNYKPGITDLNILDGSRACDEVILHTGLITP